MVYGTNIRLPGEFFTPVTANSLPDQSEFISQLRTHFRSTHTTPPRCPSTHPHIPEELSTSTHVFVRHDVIRRPLQPPYDGPYPVVKRSPKHFTININGRHDTISIDRLKPAHIDTSLVANTPEHSNEQSVSTTHPTSHSHTPITHPPTIPRSTRSAAGRRVRFPHSV